MSNNLPSSSAFDAIPASAVSKRVLLVIRMTAWAFRLCTVSMRSMASSVALVIAPRPPPQVLQPRIRTDSVVVARLHPIRARTNERFQNKPVNTEPFHLACDAESHARVAIRSDRERHLAASALGEDFAAITDQVAILVAEDRCPAFHQNSANGGSGGSNASSFAPNSTTGLPNPVSRNSARSERWHH